MKKLLLVQKFDKMLCAVKSMCNNRSTALLFPNILETDISIDVVPNKARIEYIKCYGDRADGCFDEELMAEIINKLKEKKKLNEK